jgi:hypothetical protein
MQFDLYSKLQDEVYRRELGERPSRWAYQGVYGRPIGEMEKVVVLDTPIRNRFGDEQKIYRINRRNAASHSVLRASLIVSVDQDGRQIIDDETAHRILNSIIFD